MAWMRTARMKIINLFLAELKSKGSLSHDEALRYLMDMPMLSRGTAERYIQDLLFIGRIIEKQNKIILRQEAGEDAKTRKDTKTHRM